MPKSEDRRKDRDIKPGTRYNIIVRQSLASALIKMGQRNHVSVSKVVELLLSMAMTGNMLITGEMKRIG